MRPLLVQDQMLHQRVTQPHHRRAFVLCLDLQRIERLADVAREHEPRDVDHADFRIDLDLDGRAHELPELRTAAERVLGTIATAALLADADDLAARRTEARLEHLDVRQFLARRSRTVAGTDLDRVFVDAETPWRPVARSWALMSAHALITALPMNTVERLADVEES